MPRKPDEIKNQTSFELVEVDAITELGSVEIVCGPEHLDRTSVLEAETLEQRRNARVASGGYTKNIGAREVNVSLDR